MGFKGAWWVVKTAFTSFFKDDAMTLGAALAYYTALSIAPLLVLLVWATSALGPKMQDKLVNELVGLIGKQGGEAIQMIVHNAKQRPDLGHIAGYISLGVLLFSAAGVFGQLQASLNRLWNVKSKPKAGIWDLVRKRLLSFGMVFTIGFLLLVSMAVSAGISMVLGSVRDSLPGGETLWHIVNFVTPLIVIIPLFALIFEYLPDAIIRWRDVWMGAAVTGVLFAIGKLLIGLYLGHGSVGSAYGAAGSLIVLLVWVFYSSLILFFGAELTQAWMARRGTPIQPSKHAVWADDCNPGEERAERAGSVRKDRRAKANDRLPRGPRAHPAQAT
jgi:membrane protein